MEYKVLSFTGAFPFFFLSVRKCSYSFFATSTFVISPVCVFGVFVLSSSDGLLSLVFAVLLIGNIKVVVQAKEAA